MIQGNPASINILHRLKETTADVHRRVEERLDLFGASFDMDRYVVLLQRFYGFWAPIEANLQRTPELYHPALALHDRLKSHLLEADLRVFHIDSGQVARCTELPSFSRSGQALGCMYVLEGSTLGSRFIARHLADRFQIDGGSGAAFFNAYGGATGARWAEFREFLISHTDSSSADEVLGSAIKTFECLDGWLAGAPGS